MDNQELLEVLELVSILVKQTNDSIISIQSILNLNSNYHKRYNFIDINLLLDLESKIKTIKDKESLSTL